MLVQSTSSPETFSQRSRWAGGEPIANVLMAQALAHPELVSLAAGFVDHQTLPAGPTREAFEHLWADPARAGAALQYGTTIGFPPLREAILQRMKAAETTAGASIDAGLDQVVVTAGSNQLLYLVGDVLFDPGDIVLAGAPTYYVYLGTLNNFGVRTLGVEIDDRGLVPEALESELARLDHGGMLDRVRAIYVTTYYDNPTGVTVPAERRAEYVEIAQRWSRHRRIYVIEDAAYRELRYSGDDIPSMRALDPHRDMVIHAGTFSKSFSPGIRIGWGVLPPELVGPVLAAKGNLDFGSPNFNQMLMAAVLELGLFDGHVEQLRRGYREKLDAMLEAADRFLAPIGGVEWVRPGGGLYLWLRLPEGIDTGLGGELFRQAVDEGVLYVPGDYCYPRGGRPVPKNMLRLSFGVPSCEDIRRGMESLGRAIRAVI